MCDLAVVIYINIQYGLDLWGERNNHIHGDTPTNQRYILQQKTIKRATDLYKEGEGTVPRQQQRLFHNFERRIEGSTKSLQGWIDIVLLAQEQHRKDEEELKNQPKIDTFFAKVTSTQEHLHTRPAAHQQRDSTISNTSHVNKKNNWAQQDLRRLFLRPNPNRPL